MYCFITTTGVTCQPDNESQCVNCEEWTHLTSIWPNFHDSSIVITNNSGIQVRSEQHKPGYCLGLLSFTVEILYHSSCLHPCHLSWQDGRVSFSLREWDILRYSCLIHWMYVACSCWTCYLLVVWCILSYIDTDHKPVSFTHHKGIVMFVSYLFKCLFQFKTTSLAFDSCNLFTVWEFKMGFQEQASWFDGETLQDGPSVEHGLIGYNPYRCPQKWGTGVIT